MDKIATPARPAHPFPARPGELADEFRRLTALGVNQRAAQAIVARLAADAERQLAETVRAYAAARERRRKRAISRRPKSCPRCPMTVQAGNLARHYRRVHSTAQAAAQAA